MNWNIPPKYERLYEQLTKKVKRPPTLALWTQPLWLAFLLGLPLGAFAMSNYIRENMETLKPYAFKYVHLLLQSTDAHFVSIV
jgi:ABC-type antimicrobial peptide transport system permease subunit